MATRPAITFGAARRIGALQLEERSPRAAVLIATAGMALLYLALFNGHMQTADGLTIYRQGMSLAYDHSLRLHPAIWWGEWYTTALYGVGLPLLYAPGLLLASGLRPLVPVQAGPTYDWALLYADPLYTIAAAGVHLILVIASAYLVARLLQRLGFGTGIALWGLALYGVGSPALVVARGDTAQSVEGFAWVACIYAAVMARQSGRTRWLWACGVAACLAILARQGEGAFVVPAALVIITPDVRVWRWPVSVWRSAAVVAGPVVLAIGITLAVDWVRFGSPLNTGYPASWTTPVLVGLAGVLVSPGRGMLWAFPAVVLVPLGFRVLWRRRERAAALALSGLCLALMLTVALWTWWWGGYNWGLRLFFPALPLLAVLAGAGITGLPRSIQNGLPGLLLLGGLVWVMPCVITDLLGGYAGTYASSDASFHLHAYPPLGAWRFFQHWRALSLEDSHAADILWLRLARPTHNWSLVPPLISSAGAASLWSWLALSRTSPRRR